MRGGAVIRGSYRYLLWREWYGAGKTVAFIMLNPSRADANTNDPTITRCLKFAWSWGYGRLEIVNLFAYRTPHPSLLKQTTEPVGKDNDKYILATVRRSHRVILAWGNYGTWQRQDIYVLQLIQNYTHLYCLGMTKHNCPHHPLYLRSTTTPQVFKKSLIGRSRP